MSIISDPIRFLNKEEYESRPNYQTDLRCDASELDCIVGLYEFAKKDYVKCQFNGCRRMHGAGYLIRTKDGRESNCGNDCGAREFGVAFEEIERHFKVRLDRYDSRQVIYKFKNDIPDLFRTINDMEAEFKILAEFLRRFTDAIANDDSTDKFIRRCEGGAVVRERRITKHMRRWGQFPAHQLAISEPIGTIYGYGAINKSRHIQSKWDELFGLIEKLALMDPDSIPDHEVPAHSYSIKLFREDLIEISDFIAIARLFMSPKNTEIFRQIKSIVPSNSPSAKNATFREIEALFVALPQAD